MAGDELTPRKDPADALATAQALTASMGQLASEVNELNRLGHRNRRMIWGLAASLALDIILTGGIAWTATQAQSANGAAKQNRVTHINVCMSGNVARQQNLQLWEYVLSVPPSTPPTEKQKQQREQFRVRVHQIFAPRDCDRI